MPYKQQKKVLGSQVETLIEEKKEKENVFTYLELVNLKNAFLLNYEELKRKVVKAGKKKVGGGKGVLEEFVMIVSIIGDYIGIEEEYGPNLCQEKVDYEHMVQYYILMRIKNKMKDYEEKFEDWREIIECFAKELEKNLVQ